MEEDATTSHKLQAAGVRSRSRSPRLQAAEPAAEASAADASSGSTSTADGSWAAKWRQAMSRKLGCAGVENEAVVEDASPEADAEVAEAAPAEEVSTTKEPAEEMQAEQVQAEEVVYEFPCHGCELGFHESSKLHEHLRASASCLARPLQAVIDQVGCLPGAGSTLWCPACPDDYIGKWTGPATKASALLRHVSAASLEGSLHEAQHRRFHAALVEMVIEEMPVDYCDATLQEWSAGSKLLQIAGPLLAGALARRAVEKLQDEMLGKDPSVVSVPVEGYHVATPQADVGPDPEAEKSKMRILGLDLSVDDGAGSALYEDLDKEIGHDPGALTAGMGCPLPSGGLKGLTSFDLTLSSDEEALETKGPGNVTAVASGRDDAVEGCGEDSDDENMFL